MGLPGHASPQSRGLKTALTTFFTAHKELSTGTVVRKGGSRQVEKNHIVNEIASVTNGPNNIIYIILTLLNYLASPAPVLGD